MLTRTLAQIRDAIQRTADVVSFVDKHPITYLNDLANRGLGALSRVCRTTNQKFQPIASTLLTCDGVNTVYSLPATFRSLISVEYTHAGRKIWLEPHNLNERANLTSPDIATGPRCSTGYLVTGTNIELLPLPTLNDTAFLWFATTVTQLVSDSSTVDVMDRLDDYVIWWAAREIANERENWERYDRLSQALANLEGDIRILARSIDLSEPAKITNTREANGIDRFGRRYRRGWSW